MTGVAWEDQHLFDLGTVPEVTPSAGGVLEGEAKALSAGRRLTIRNNTLLAAGRHPATGYPLLGGPFVPGPVQEGPTCGVCSHLTGHHHNSRTYYKCGLVVVTNGAGTDIRLSWPACTRFEAAA